MSPRVSLAHVLAAIGLVLLVVPALVPVQPVLYHDTRGGATYNRTQLEAHGVRVVAYENLSARGKEIYRQALLHHGVYTVPVGQGASEFNYSTSATQRRGRPAGGGIAIERDPNATNLPPADEPLRAARYEQRRAQAQARKRAGAEQSGGNDTAGNDTRTATPSRAERQRQLEQRRRQIARYDLMETHQGSPPLTASSNLARLLSVVVGVLAIGVGGYRASRP
ncbi:MAG: hypothetical protein ABEI77_02455 [Halorientalis sp.]